MPPALVGYTSGIPDGVVGVTVAGPRFCPKIEMISRGETDVALGGTGFAPVPVCTAVGRYEAALTTVVMPGCVGLVTVKVVVAGACDGLFGGARSEEHTSELQS